MPPSQEWSDKKYGAELPIVARVETKINQGASLVQLTWVFSLPKQALPLAYVTRIFLGTPCYSMNQENHALTRLLKS